MHVTGRLSRRVTAVCIMNGCVDTAALNVAMATWGRLRVTTVQKHALLMDAIGNMQLWVTAGCTTPVSGERAALSLAASRQMALH